MPEKKHLHTALRLLYTALIVLLLWLLAVYVLPCLLPFLLALAFSALLERPIRFLMRCIHLPRTAASALCTLIFSLLLTGSLFLLLWRLGQEAITLLDKLPDLLSALSGLFNRLRGTLERLLIAAPIPLQEPLHQAMSQLMNQGLTLAGQVSAWLAALLARWAAALPGLGLFLFTTALATFFASADHPNLLAFLGRQIPETWRPKLSRAANALKDALSSWLRAQGLLMLITFGILSIGFLLLQVDLAVLCAALTALLDALPVFGTGIVLIPWAVFVFFRGEPFLALGLLSLYVVLFLARSMLEPRLVGKGSGLPPLAALLAMYAGFASFGTPGMILAPLVAILIKELHDRGIFHLWKE